MTKRGQQGIKKELIPAGSELSLEKEIKKRPATRLILSAIPDPYGFERNEEYIQHLAYIVESSDDAIISKSLDGVIKTWNKGSNKMFGYTAKQAVGKHISIIIPAKYINEEKKIIAKIRNNEIIDHYETVRVRKNGKQFHVSITASPLKDLAGNIIGVSKIARDLTSSNEFKAALIFANKELAFQNKEKEKRAGELIIANKKLIFQSKEKEKRAAELLLANKELKETEDALRKSNEIFFKLFDCNPAAIAIRNDIDDKIINVNEAFVKMFEFSCKDELIGKSIFELNLVNKEQNTIIKLSQEDKPGKHLETNAKTIKGNELCVSLSLLKIQIEGIPCIISVLIDITERKKAEQQLKITNEELYCQNIEKEKKSIQLIAANRGLKVSEEQFKEVNKELESFSYSISHDLRAPLRAVLGYSKKLERNFETQLDPEARRLMNNIMDNAKRMGQLIDDLLHFSRVGRKDLVKNKRPDAKYGNGHMQ